MTTERFLVGLGHPRCGTGFTAALLEQAGIEIGHERTRRNGIISWCAAAQTDKVPWGDALGPIKFDHDVFCIARSPLAALPSIVPEMHRPRSYRFIAKTINTLHTDTVMPEITADGLLKAALSYCHWFDLCLSHAPDIIYRVDVAQDDTLLSDYVGHRVDRSDDIARNHKKRHVKPDLSRDDYGQLPGPLRDQLATTSDALGYPEAATFFASLSDG